MHALTQRALRVFAVLEEYRQGSKDIIEAILPFFKPLLEPLSGRVFEPRDFARTVSETYGWNFSADIAEELVTRFVSAGWLSETDSAGHTYVVEDISLEDEGLDTRDIEHTLSKVTEQFAEFKRELSPLTMYAKTKEQLSDILVEWLVSIDAYNESVLRENAIQKSTEGTLAIYQELPDGSSLSSEDKYLCARFVKKLVDENSHLLESLTGIAAAGLLTEVVRDFHKPVTKVQQSTLAIYLDSSVALEFLGVSGAEACRNVRSVIEGAQSIGCSVRVFYSTLDEMSHALDAVLKRDRPAREGPTATAMRRGEVEEAYVREVARNPSSFLERKGIGIVRRSPDQFPNEHDYFSKDLIEALYSRINWHTNPTPRQHDAVSTALIMRMRKGVTTRDIFSAQHVFVTRNGMLAQMARRFCIDEEILSNNDLPPVVHQRQLATALWLRTGDGVKSNDIPRHAMLVF
ncbi:MAG: hypothetical protein GVY06_08815 [Alphaproteobacteria bacterium]|jgi:hypothetical protein|nr:hypothetical protein [Alphaproteobacteria bacterium]